jgi:hypothetical protein
MGELNEARGEAAVQKRIERATQPLLDENERLREALEFYAERPADSYNTGQVARDALHKEGVEGE